ncbi:MAG: hypothetical protein L0Z50_36595 [Verrucomicrobiales bacterium]|nr:hypothetical protein [Verrucomicrobiales bacterium]
MFDTRPRRAEFQWKVAEGEVKGLLHLLQSGSRFDDLNDLPDDLIFKSAGAEEKPKGSGVYFVTAVFEADTR